MKKYTITILILLILGLTGGGYYWYWQSKESGTEVVNKTNTEIASETVSEEILPSISPNPLENKADINPVDQTNPYANIKTNPFE